MMFIYACFMIMTRDNNKKGSPSIKQPQPNKFITPYIEFSTA